MLLCIALDRQQQISDSRAVPFLAVSVMSSYNGINSGLQYWSDSVQRHHNVIVNVSTRRFDYPRVGYVYYDLSLIHI